MSSILLLTTSPQEAAELQGHADSIGARVRYVSSASAAREWLAMQAFEALLVDARLFETEENSKIVDLGWKYNPLMRVIIYHASEWNDELLRLYYLGAQVFLEPYDAEEVAGVLKTLPKSTSLISPGRVLVVEDLDAARDIIATYVQALGYTDVSTAHSVDNALQQLRSNPAAYFCIITDLNMPHRNGVELIQEVRSDAALDHLPIIVLTANASADNLIACIREGATGFLVKPMKKKQLNQELEKAKRISARFESPRLCAPDNLDALQQALIERGGLIDS